MRRWKVELKTIEFERRALVPFSAKFLHPFLDYFTSSKLFKRALKQAYEQLKSPCTCDEQAIGPQLMHLFKFYSSVVLNVDLDST